MTLSNRIFLPLLAGASLAVLAACGGSDSSDTTSATVSETATEAAETATETAETAAEDTAAVVDDAADAAADAADDAVEAATDAADDAADAVETAAADAAAGAGAIAAAAQDAADDAAAAVTEASDRVSEEMAAQYASLTGDAEAGRRVFTKCMACHVVQEGQNRVGPSLYGIIGREAGTIPNYSYSEANATSGIVWTEPVMFTYLENPRGFLPGTKMAFPGLPSAQERADVIAYLKSAAS